MKNGEMKQGYRIFTSYAYRKNSYRKNLWKNTFIRIDLFNYTPIWKVKELLSCRNWKVTDKLFFSNGESRYYIQIL